MDRGGLPGLRPTLARETTWVLPVVAPVVAAGSAAVTAAVVTLAAERPSGSTLLGLLALLAAAVVAEALPFPIEGVEPGAASLATIALSGTAVIYGWAPAVVVAGLTMAIVEVGRRRPAIRTLYNTALYALSATAAGVVADSLVVLGGIWMLFVAATAAAVAFYAVDIALLAAVIGRVSRERFFPLYWRYIRTTALPIAIMTSLTVLLVEVWRIAAPLAAALVGPLVALALYQRSLHRAIEAMRLARTDPLTGLGNARGFHERLEDELQNAERSGTPVAVCVVDVDEFKKINDTYGHAVGDSVLTAIAAGLRAKGEAFRLGGDEFVLVLPHCDKDQARAVAGAVLRRVRDRSTAAGVQATVSIGIAVALQHAADPKTLLRLADQGLYAAKAAGRNRLEVYNPGIGTVATLRLVREPERTARLQAAASLAHAVDARDTYTGSHSHAVGELAAAMATRMGLDPDDIELVRLAGRLHDLGKLAVPEEILRKPDALTPPERLVLERHPEIGYRMLDSLEIEPVAQWVRHHHERWDGRGYPTGLAMDAIPLGARIIFVADAYHAMTSDRTYQSAVPPARALAELERCAGTQFDPGVVAAFRADFDALSAAPWAAPAASVSLPGEL